MTDKKPEATGPVPVATTRPFRDPEIRPGDRCADYRCADPEIDAPTIDAPTKQLLEMPRTGKDNLWGRGSGAINYRDVF